MPPVDWQTVVRLMHDTVLLGLGAVVHKAAIRGGDQRPVADILT